MKRLRVSFRLYLLSVSIYGEIFSFYSHLFFCLYEPETSVTAKCLVFVVGHGLPCHFWLYFLPLRAGNVSDGPCFTVLVSHDLSWQVFILFICLFWLYEPETWVTAKLNLHFKFVVGHGLPCHFWLYFLPLRAGNVSDGPLFFLSVICRRARFTVPFLIVFPAFTSRKREWRPMFCIANFIMNLTDSIQIKKTITTEATEHTEKTTLCPRCSLWFYFLDKKANPKR